MSKRTELKPFFSFYGGKWRSAPKYPKPCNGIIIEPFAGSAGYSVRHYDGAVVLIEKDPVVYSTWKYLMHCTEEEILSLPDVKDHQSVYDLNVCQEARYLIGWWLNKGCSAPRNYPSSWMRSKTTPKSYWGPEIRNRISQQLKYVRHWEVILGDYRECYDVEATWFIDPPYKNKGNLYKFGSDRIDYDELAFFCSTRRGQVIVCENYGADWLPFSVFDLNSQATPGLYRLGVSREVVYIQ